MHCRLFLDVVVRDGSAVLETLSSEDKALLVSRNAFLLLDLGFHCLNRVSRLDINGDGSACERLYENLHFCHSFFFLVSFLLIIIL